jgi:hypothetical protein
MDSFNGNDCQNVQFIDKNGIQVSLEYVLIDNQKNIFFVSGQTTGQSYLENVLSDT